MTTSENSDIELIISYFEAELSEVEIKAFEKRLKTDVFFAQKVEDYLLSVDIVETRMPDLEKNERTKRWKTILTEDINTSKVEKRKWYPMALGIAASFVIFIVAFLVEGSTIDYSELTQKAWDKEVGLEFAVRGDSNNTTEKNLLESLEAYHRKEYDYSLILLKKYDNSFVRYHDVILLRSLSLYRLQRSNEAFQTLDTLATKNKSLANWYKGLIYISNGEVEKAQEYLKIPEDEEGELQLK